MPRNPESSQNNHNNHENKELDSTFNLADYISPELKHKLKEAFAIDTDKYINSSNDIQKPNNYDNPRLLIDDLLQKKGSYKPDDIVELLKKSKSETPSQQDLAYIFGLDVAYDTKELTEQNFRDLRTLRNEYFLKAIEAFPDKADWIIAQIDSIGRNDLRKLLTMDVNFNVNQLLEIISYYEISVNLDSLLECGADANIIAQKILPHYEDWSFDLRETTIEKLLAKGADTKTIVSNLEPWRILQHLELLLSYQAEIDINEVIKQIDSIDSYVEDILRLKPETNVNLLVSKMSARAIIENLKLLREHGAKININRLVSKMSARAIIANLKLLREHGAKIPNINKLVAEVDDWDIAKSITKNLPALLALKANPDLLVEKLNSDRVEENLNLFLEYQASIDSLVKKMDYWAVYRQLNIILEHQANMDLVISKLAGVNKVAEHIDDLMSHGASVAQLLNGLYPESALALPNFLHQFKDKTDKDKLIAKLNRDNYYIGEDTFKNFDILLSEDFTIDDLASKLRVEYVYRHLSYFIDRGAQLDFRQMIAKVAPDKLANTESLSILLDQGVDVNQIVSRLEPVGTANNLELLLNHGASIDMNDLVSKLPDDYWVTSESSVPYDVNNQRVQSFLNAGIDINIIAEKTAHHRYEYSSAYYSPEILDALLNLGASIDRIVAATDMHGSPKFIVPLLLSRGAKVEQLVDQMEEEDLYRCLPVILEHQGASELLINKLNLSSQTWSVRRSTVKTLIEHQVNAEWLMKDLSQYEVEELLEFLLEHQVSVQLIIDKLNLPSLTYNRQLVRTINKLLMRHVEINTIVENLSDIQILENRNYLLDQGMSADILAKLVNVYPGWLKEVFYSLSQRNVDIRSLIDKLNPELIFTNIRYLREQLSVAIDGHKLVDRLNPETFEKIELNHFTLGPLLDCGADINQIVQKLKPKAIFSILPYLQEHGAQIDAEDLAAQLEPEDFVENSWNTERLLQQGADANKIFNRLTARQALQLLHVWRGHDVQIKGQEFVEQLSADDFASVNYDGERLIDELLSYGAEINQIVAKLNPATIYENLNYIMESGAQIDTVIDTIGATSLSMNPSKIMDLLHYGASIDKLKSKLSEVGVDWKLEVLPEHPWLIHEFNTANPETVAAANEFPLTGSDRLKWKWCYDHAFVHLDGDWPAATIGKIIFTRLEAGIDSNLHDASYWLQTFIIPNYSYNIAAIKNAVTNDEPIESLDKYQLILRNHYTELGLLAKILQVEPTLRERINLSRKEQVVTTLFTSPENILLYQELVKMMREPECNLQLLQEKVREELEVFYQERIQNTAGKPSQWRVSLEEFGKRVQETLEKLGQMTQSQQSEMSISDLITQLKTYGQNRKLYIDDASAWLEKHMVSPSLTITKAWGDRALALANGTDDKASEIISWQRRNALLIAVQKNPELLTRYNLTSRELKSAYKSFTEELSRVYNVETILRGVWLYKQNANPEKNMPAKRIELTLNDEKIDKSRKRKKFTGEILAHDDPRGETIGYDTGCCMTIDGVSESCIASGYSDKEAGFFALYDPDGQLMAQSYFYINPKHPDVVIMDNIEANEGRDFDKILKLYQQFFREYFLEQFAGNPDWQVRQVNIGEGYTDVNLQGLVVTESIANSHSGVYSDARNQRLLFRLSDEEIAQARQKQTEQTKEVKPVAVTHKTVELTRTLGTEQLPIIQALEAQLYPENMCQYDDEDFAVSELSQPGVGKYSFLIETQTDANRQAVGYCLAYEADAETDPQYPDKVVYIADFGIVPEAQASNAALKGLNELLKRLDDNQVQKVELDARESTSYRFFKSEAGQRYLTRHGYQVKEYDTTTEFDNGEKTYMLSLEKVDNQNNAARPAAS